MRQKLLLVGLAFVVPFVSQAFERVNGQKYLVIAGRQPAPFLDPHQKYDQSTRMLQGAMYDTLVRYQGKEGRIVPWLAKSWEISEDSTTWTFHLDSRAKFHNGSPVDAQAIRASFLRNLELNKGPAWMFQDFLDSDRIQVVDSQTLKFVLKKPYAPFLSLLPWWFIVNVEEAKNHEKDGDYGQAWLNNHSAGSGPFATEKIEHGNFYQLKAVKNYWRGWEGDAQTLLGGFVYKLMRETSSQRAALLKGEADIVVDLTEEELAIVKKKKGIQVNEKYPLKAFALQFNTQGQYTSDIHLRKALAYAFDYDALIAIYNGNAALQTSPFNSGIRGHIQVEGIPRQDMKKAKQHLAKSKWAQGGIELDYIYVQGFEEERQMGLVLIDSMKPLNIKIKMVPLTWPNMVARGSQVETSPDIFAAFKTPASNDPDLVAYMYHKNSWGKYYGTQFLEDAKLNRLIDQARGLAEWSARLGIYVDIQRRIVELQPEIFGMQKIDKIAYRTWVKGIVTSPVKMRGELDIYPIRISR